MTIIYKSESFKSNAGLNMFIEQYADKPDFVKYWRYGAEGRTWSKDLLSRPNKKRLIENY